MAAIEVPEAQARDDGCEVPDADAGLPPVPEPPDQADDCGRPSGRVRRVVAKIVPPLIGAGALYTAVEMAGGMQDGLRALRTVDPGWIVAAVACEVASFVLLGLHLRQLSGPSENVRRIAPIRTALIVFGLGSVLPAAPVEGLAMASAALRHRRVARRRALLVLGVSQWFATTGLYVLAAINALVVVAILRLPVDRWMMGIAGAGTLAVVATLGYLCTRRRFAEWVALALGRMRRPRHTPPAAERRARGAAWHEAAAHVVSGPRAWAVLMATATGAWFADAMCLYTALLALGAHVDVPLLVLAYAGSAIAAELPLLPAGVGAVEVAAPAILALGGVPGAIALGAIVIYRLVGTVLPAVAGAMALASLRATPPPPSGAATPPTVTPVPHLLPNALGAVATPT